eukprot:774210-Rhodomonas_salina.1
MYPGYWYPCSGLVRGPHQDSNWGQRDLYWLSSVGENNSPQAYMKTIPISLSKSGRKLPATLTFELEQNN